LFVHCHYHRDIYPGDCLGSPHWQRRYPITTQSGLKIAVFAAIAATLIIAIITFIAAALSGSSAMIAEVLQITSIDEIVLHEGMTGRGVEKTASLLSLCMRKVKDCS